MEPIKFKGYNLIISENQPEYIPLPVYKDNYGTVVSCWKLTLRERIKILFLGKLYLQILTFNALLQPQKPTVDYPLD